MAIETRGLKRVEAHKNRTERKLHAKTLQRNRENEEHYLNGFEMFEHTL
jgi:hypothetical protein